MDLTDFSKLKLLIIEDVAEARILLKTMLNDFGFHNITVATRAESAVGLLRSYSFDIILCDYNLGSGKDGQQLLEEVRYSQLIPNTSTFIMVTAETSIEMVMGAIEYHPDGYISKPFSQAILKRRLVKLLEMKKLLYQVNQALDKADYEAAILEADHVIQAHPNLEAKCNRIKGDCLLELKKYDEANALFSKEIAHRKMPWALFGLAKTAFITQQYQEAESRFRQLTLNNRYFVNAYDWLAKCLEAQNKIKEAHEVLLQAVNKSPKAILRQAELGRLSLALNDYITAEMAYRRAIFLGKYSVHNSRILHIKHLRTFLGLAETDQLQPQHLETFQSYVAKAKKKFLSNPEMKAQTYQIEVELYLSLNDLGHAKSSFAEWKNDIEQGNAIKPSLEFETACMSLLEK